MQDAATELSKKHKTTIKIWFLDDIEEEVQLYPRLIRIYSEGGAKDVVQLIDKDFIDGLNEQLNTDKSPPDVFQFYSGIYANNSQWIGILKNLDAPRKHKKEIDIISENLFEEYFLDTRIAAIVHGEGGSGKSTLLRRIAMDNAVNKPYFNCWVEDVDYFLEYDAYSVSANREQKHLIFIDDWYRNEPKDKGRGFFLWLREQRIMYW